MANADQRLSGYLKPNSASTRYLAVFRLVRRASTLTRRPRGSRTIADAP
jgi:hypothetical protein